MRLKKTLLTLMALFMAASGMPVYAEQAPEPEVTETDKKLVPETGIASALGVKKLEAEEPGTLTTGQMFNAAIKSLAAGTSTSYEDSDSQIQSIQVTRALPSEGITTKDVSANKDGSYLAWWDAGTSTIYLYSKSGDIVLNPDSSDMFNNCYSLTTLDVSKWNTSSVTNMSDMFGGCGLTTLDLSGWNTGSVTNMSDMFNNCTSLTSMGVSKWNTGSVTNMDSMFKGCYRLTTLDVSDWNTSQVKNMSNMFNYCSSLTSINISRWNTSSVTDMYNMFSSCTSLTALDVSKWNTGSVTNMSGLFNGCSGLATLDVSMWNTGKVTDMSWLFSGCSNLNALNVSNWNTGRVTDMSGMFDWCSSLTTLDVSNWNTGNVTNMNQMFEGCSKLTVLNVSKWNTGSVTNMIGLFNGCGSLATLSISKWDTSSVTSMSRMFYDCYSLASLDVSRWDTSSVTDMDNMFDNCSSLATLDVSRWDTSSVTNMSGMFSSSSLNDLDLSSWNTGSVTNMSYMFYKCSELTTIYVGSGWDTSKVTASDSMFAKCANLPNFDSNVVDKIHANADPDSGYMSYKVADLTYLKDSSFVLSGTSDYGNPVNMVVTSNKNGRMSFKNLEKGTYTLTEVSPTDGYIKNSVKYTVTVTDSGVSVVSDNPAFYYETADQKVLFNEPYHTFSIQKVSNENHNLGVAGAEFLLSGVSDYGTEVSQSKITGDTGMATFDHLEAGSYLLIETKAPEHFALDPVSRIVTINKYGVVKIDGLSKEGSAFVWVDIRNADETVTITKNWKDTLTGTDAANRALPSIVISDQRTIPDAVTITYDARDGHFGTDPSNTKNIVTYTEKVDKDGNIVSVSVSKGQELIPSMTGKTFDAWYLDSALTNKMQGSIADYIKENPNAQTIPLYAKYKDPPMLTTGKLFNKAIKSLAAGTNKYYSDTDSLIQSVQVVDTPPSEGITTKDVSANNDGSYLVWWDAGTSTINLYSESGSVILNPDSSFMFYSCYRLTTLDVSDWNTNQVTRMNSMFHGCSRLTSLAVSNWDTSKTTNMGAMFYNCLSLTTLDISNWDTSQVTSMLNIFQDCSSLTTLDVSKWDTSKVTNMSGMFGDCSRLTYLNVSNWDTSQVTDMYRMFPGCKKLTALDVSKWNTSQVTDMFSMFQDCGSLTTMDLSGWDTSQVTDMSGMFWNCSSLVAIYIGPGWNTDKVTRSSGMFRRCTKLPNFDSSVVADKTHAHAGVGGYMTRKS